MTRGMMTSGMRWRGTEYVLNKWNETIIEYRIKWKDHLNKQPDDNIDKEAWQYIVRSKQDRGHPKVRTQQNRYNQCIITKVMIIMMIL